MGRDASVAIGKMKFDERFTDPAQLHWSLDLTLKEANVLHEWTLKFEEKFALVR